MAEWGAELDDESEDDADAVLDVDDVGDFVAEADPLVVLGAGAGVASSLSTVKAARRLVVLPYRQVRTS